MAEKNEQKKEEKKDWQTQDKYKFATEKPRKQIFIDNAIGGLAWGVGSIIGATVIIGVLGLVISRSRNIPLIGDVVNVIIEEINQGKNSNIFNPDNGSTPTAPVVPPTNPVTPQPTNPPSPETPVSGAQ